MAREKSSLNSYRSYAKYLCAFLLDLRDTTGYIFMQKNIFRSRVK